tara:strand:+ start:320 stop:1264 length:945 start_codon:yes stop_codon:yes gene_type:complete
MEFVLFNDGKPGVLKGDKIVDLSKLVENRTGQEAMSYIITNLERLRATIETSANDYPGTPLKEVVLGPPLPHPGKILCMGGNFTEFGHRAPGPMWGFLKSSDAVIGPNQTVILPDIDANIFHHEAELVLVFNRYGKNIAEKDALDYVFGYTCGVDVSARMPANPNNPPAEFQAWRGVAAHKSHKTFAPLGPSIVTRDQIIDPQNLQVQLSVDGELRGDFNTSDMAHSIAKSIAFVSQFESFDAGDVLYTGTNHQGLGAMQDGELIKIEIQQVGGFSFTVSDHMNRKWDKGIDEETAEDVRKGNGAPGRRKRPLS